MKPADHTCPMPLSDHPTVLLAHGGGGRLMRELIERVFIQTFANPTLNVRHDSAVVDVGGVRLAMTTDSYVVHPLFFPGGDIGSLAVHGTVNDLAMSGARPLFLSAGFIIEEGFPMETLRRVANSMQDAAAGAGVQIITGDTKVVDRGKGDGVYINTAGIGVIDRPIVISPARVRPGDAIVLSGDIGRHGIAIMAVREGLQFETTIESDSAPLAEPVMRLLDEGVEIHCLRDLTRGGLATALNEIASSAGVSIEIDERIISVREEVRGACELLGLDPLYVACEGRFVAFIAAEQAGRAADVLRAASADSTPAVIGRVVSDMPPTVLLTSRIGVRRIIDLQSGEQLPRIC